MGRIGPRLFLNNVSLGLYALLVHRRERRRRRGAALARARALFLVLRDHRGKIPFVIDGDMVAARVVVVACNAYSFDLFSIGERERMDDGLLHLYVPHGFRRVTWEERAAREFTLQTPRPSVQVAIDGEPATLRSPFELRVEPRALRVLVPARHSVQHQPPTRPTPATILPFMHDNPPASEEEQEQVPERLEEAEEMRGPLESDPEPPTDDGDED